MHFKTAKGCLEEGKETKRCLGGEKERKNKELYSHFHVRDKK